MLGDEHHAWATSLVSEYFGSTRVVSRGQLNETSALPCLIAIRDGDPIGLLHYRLDGSECEVVTIISVQPGRGIGASLLEAVCILARDAGCRRMWLVTTNDNQSAQGFFASAGWHRSAVYPGAVSAARSLKPEIPLLGENGTPIEDEIEYEFSIPHT